MKLSKKATLVLVALLLLGGLATASFTERLKKLFFLTGNFHGWSNLQPGEIIQRSEQPETPLSLIARAGLFTEGLEVALTPYEVTEISESAWKPFHPGRMLSFFEGRLVTSPGWKRLSSRTRSHDRVRYSPGIEFGVGEVFIVAGQSNAAGASRVLNSSRFPWVRNGRLSADAPIIWSMGADPQTPYSMGSPWPLVGDMLSDALKCPIGFINVAVGGTSIQEWEPGSPFFGNLKAALQASHPHGVRGILWLQGEADKGMAETEYYDRLARLIKESAKYAPPGKKVPWLVSQTTYGAGSISESVRRAQKRTWETGLAYPGPDTDTLKDAYRERDIVHFNREGTIHVAQLWVKCILKSLFGPVLQ